MISIEELEKNLLNIGDWRQAPSGALATVREIDTEYGGNIAIGHHSKIGYYVLHDQGVGPGLVWQELEAQDE